MSGERLAASTTEPTHMLLAIIGGTPKEKHRARKAAWKGALTDVDAQALSGEELAALASTDSLFGEARGYRLENAFAAAETADLVLAAAKDLAASPHAFVLEEEKLLAKPKAALQKAGAEIVELKAPSKKEPFNTFALANALGKRDRKALWLGLMRAADEGVAAEQLAGILAWKARTAAASAHSAEEKNVWSKTSRELVIMYHDSHRGAGDLALLLERWTLTL